MVTRLGMVPAVLCIVAAALLGGWGWGAREDSQDRATEESLRRGESEDQPLFGEGPDQGPSMVELTCGILVDAAMLQAPVDPRVVFAGPDGPTDTTMAASTIDTAWTLVGLLGEDLLFQTPELDQPDLQAAVFGLRSSLQVALQRTAEPLADPEVIAAAVTLRDALVGRCL